VLEVDGEMWCQSWTIARMLAKQFGKWQIKIRLSVLEFVEQITII